MLFAERSSLKNSPTVVREPVGTANRLNRMLVELVTKYI